MPEERTLSKASLVIQIGELRAKRNHYVSMRNKIENLYRYAKAHSDILPDVTQAHIVEDSPNFSVVAERLTSGVQVASHRISRMTEELKQTKS